MKERSKVYGLLSMILLIVIVSSCKLNYEEAIIGQWELIEIKPFENNFFSGSILALERNSRYLFKNDVKQLSISLMAKDVVFKTVDCQYEVLNDTLKIIRNATTDKSVVELYRIKELSHEKMILFELETKDIRTFMRIE